MIPLALVLALVFAGVLVVVNLGDENNDSATEPLSTTTTTQPPTTAATMAEATTTSPTATTATSQPDVPGFVGGWAGTDLDGSAMWLWIDPTAEPNRYAIVIFDEGASTCDAGLTVSAKLETSGVVLGGETFEGDSASFVCLHPDGDVALDPIVVAYTYLPDDDTLVSSLSDVIWTRTDTPKEMILRS